jgi:hypothetical protein
MTLSIDRHASPQQIYSRLMRLWQLHLSVSDPDLEQLRQLHQAICLQETTLCPERIDLCLENLQQRLRDAFFIGLELQLPIWAAAEGDALQACLEEMQR